MKSKPSNKGRGAVSNPDGRYNADSHEAVDDGWDYFDQDAPKLKTEVSLETSRSIIAHNKSPDIPFEQSINPYRGCEHGCIYCYARPAHAYVGLSPGLDFESKLFAKSGAARLLRQELSARRYQCSPIALGANTDPYQPIEKRYCITREILEVFIEFKQPCFITTKSALVERDIDLLSKLAADNLVQVNMSITTLKPELARTLEPRASSPKRRLTAIAALHEAGIPVNVMVAPIIPVLTDPELESILQSAAEAGAQSAEYILIRLPLEVAGLFEEWLQTHAPGQAKHVLNQIRESRSGKNNDSRFGSRLVGEGIFADMIAQRFNLAKRKLGLDKPQPSLNTDKFHAGPVQLDLF